MAKTLNYYLVYYTGQTISYCFWDICSNNENIWKKCDKNMIKNKIGDCKKKMMETKWWYEKRWWWWWKQDEKTWWKNPSKTFPGILSNNLLVQIYFRKKRFEKWTKSVVLKHVINWL